MANFDKQEIATQLRAVITWKANYPNMSQHEVEMMWRVAEAAGGR